MAVMERGTKLTHLGLGTIGICAFALALVFVVVVVVVVVVLMFQLLLDIQYLKKFNFLLIYHR